MDEKKTTEREEIITEVIGFSPRKLRTTFLDLLLKPGLAIAAYSDGDRSKYISPIAYFLISYGGSFIIYELSGYYSHMHEKGEIAKMISMFDSSFQSNPELREAFLRSFHIVFSKNVILLFSVPAYFVSWWLVFRRFRKPVLNHVYFFLFISAQAGFLMLLPHLILFWSFSFTTVLLWLDRVIGFVLFFLAAKVFYRISYTQTIVRVLVSQYILIYLPLAFFLFGTQAVITLAIYLFKL